MIETNLEFIKENLADIRSRISNAAQKAGKSAGDVMLVAVSKTFGADLLKSAFDQGVKDFGESYAQEAVDKIDSLNIDAIWHFIGHLQKNKVRPVVERFSMIQSIDSPELLTRIDKIAKELDRKIDVLIQVNIAGEDAKSGIDPKEVKELIERAENFKNVGIKGLMLIPPFYDDAEKNRKNFLLLKEMFEQINNFGFSNWEGKYLSMGMTDDFEIAIEEGSNMVRIGRAIFGYRRRK